MKNFLHSRIVCIARSKHFSLLSMMPALYSRDLSCPFVPQKESWKEQALLKYWSIPIQCLLCKMMMMILDP